MTRLIVTRLLRCPQNPLSFYNTLPLFKVRFASKTDFNQHTPQPLETNFGCPLPCQDTCASCSIGRRFARVSPMRSRQRLQKLFAGFSTCRAAGALPVKPQFCAQLGMCQPDSRRGNALRFNARLHSPACAALTCPLPFQSHLRQHASPCSLSTIQNAPPLFFLQTNPNKSVSGLRCRAQRGEQVRSTQG